MLIYESETRKLTSTHGRVRRKSDGLVFMCPVHIAIDETPEDYEEATGAKPSRI